LIKLESLIQRIEAQLRQNAGRRGHDSSSDIPSSSLSSQQQYPPFLSTTMPSTYSSSTPSPQPLSVSSGVNVTAPPLSASSSQAPSRRWPPAVAVAPVGGNSAATGGATVMATASGPVSPSPQSIQPPTTTAPPMTMATGGATAIGSGRMAPELYQPLASAPPSQATSSNILRSPLPPPPVAPSIPASLSPPSTSAATASTATSVNGSSKLNLGANGSTSNVVEPTYLSWSSLASPATPLPLKNNITINNSNNNKENRAPSFGTVNATNIPSSTVTSSSSSTTTKPLRDNNAPFTQLYSNMIDNVEASAQSRVTPPLILTISSTSNGRSTTTRTTTTTTNSSR
jgi:hypothetical protein